MTPEQLANLACLAIDDDAALQVLQDALQETYPLVEVTRRAVPVYGVRGQIVGHLAREQTTNVRLGDEEYETHGLPGPGDAFARGLASVLLFGSWSETMWPVVERCVVPETDEELRQRLLGYWSPWAEGPTEHDIETATGARLDALARDSYGMPRRCR